MILQSTRRPPRPILIGGVTLFVVLALLTVTFHPPLREKALSFSTHLHGDTHDLTTAASDKKLHIILPASNGAVDLCKTLLTGTILGYPTPTLIAWNETFDKGHLLGGGSHVAKISGTLEYLEAMPSSQDEDLVLMMDAYGIDSYSPYVDLKPYYSVDIWMQLRPEVLIGRYYAINAAANKRLKARLGNAVKAEKLKQTIIFGAGKRCAPNQMHTVACYPVPESPLPDDVYGANTDTVMGRNKYTSLKQRYLNSGYIIGPVADVRRMFKRAWEKVEGMKDFDEWDNGSHGSDFMYHGSDQSIFNIMLGEQEFQREVMRRRHLSSYDKVRGRGKPRPLHLEGTTIKDPLNPDFTHEPVEWKDGQPDEFSMGLDYFSELGHQTVNAEEDVHYLHYDKNITEQLKERKGLFDCPSRVNGTLPSDILATSGPLADLANENLNWTEASLFTNLCLNTVPVMIHHNGDKGARAWQWPMTWMQPHARKLLENARERSNSNLDSTVDISTGGAFLPEGTRLGWDELCPAEYEWELFRDVEKTSD